MKNFLTLLALTFAWVQPATAQADTDRGRAGLVGPVRTVRAETARASDESGQPAEGERVLTQLLSFDEKGNVTGQSVFNPDGSPNRKLGWGYTYDAEGRESERTFLNAEGALTSRSVSAYDKKGRKTETTFYNPGGPVNHVQTFAYDDRGRVMREVHLNPDGTIRNSSVYTYDADGRLAERAQYKPDGALIQKRISTYDGKGRETDWAIHRGDGAPVMSQKRSYDERGNVVESVSYVNGAQVSRETSTYEFDARGNWVKRRVAREAVKKGASHTEVEVNYRTITYY
jgi:antitoxin component YwqK of YwqJK toxin-antitoxin module